MSTPETVTLYHASPSRSSTTLIMLEEVGAPYRVELIDLKKNDQLAPDYLRINPLGKVPAIEHKGQVVTETVAILLYLADEFPTAGLAPSIGDPLRGPYLRWMALYAAAWEPAMVDRAAKRDPGTRAMSPYGSFDMLFQMLTDQLAAGPWMLGDRYSTVDVLWHSALNWMTMFKMLPENAAVTAYLARGTERPALARARAREAEFMGKANG